MTRTTPDKDRDHVTTFFIVDDHADFRRQARALLEDEGVLVVGEAVDGRSALMAVAAVHPDVVLLDIGLPDMDGFEVARVLLALDPAPGVVLISSRDAATYGDRVPASPAAGFVRKDDVSLAALAELVAVVRGPGGTE